MNSLDSVCIFLLSLALCESLQQSGLLWEKYSYRYRSLPYRY